MKKEVTIRSENKEIMLTAQAVSLKDSFLLLGFETRAAFVKTVCDYFPKYNNIEGISKLQRFWAFRLTDKSVNDDVETVINKLSYE